MESTITSYEEIQKQYTNLEVTATKRLEIKEEECRELNQ
jgi:hypothetical protein